MNKDGNPWRIIGMIGSLGMEIVVLSIGGTWLGNKLDAVWGTKPFMLLIGVLLGLGLGFVSAIFTLKAFAKE
jgi:F0F1-type ATP synthase assembly protein I